MNALRAPLTALAAPQEECCYFLIDNADVVIDGILHQAQGEHFIGCLAALIFLLQITRLKNRASTRWFGLRLIRHSTFWTASILAFTTLFLKVSRP
jgi:hypothetical protein